MDLHRRLARLDPLARKPAAGYAPALPNAAMAPERPDTEAALTEVLGLHGIETPDGPVWSRQDERPQIAPPPWPAADLTGILNHPDAAMSGWDDVLCLDTETTGLAGGTGTLAFLVGLGWWQDGRFTVRQLFLPGPHREAALLADLARFVARFKIVATYNGNAFDLPLLRTRALMNRGQDPCRDLSSWDLLTAARRLWGRTLPDCRQQTVESRICGFQRGPGDIEGALIPGVYQAFLQRGEFGPLAAVLLHNRRDIEGLGLVLRAIAAAADDVASGPRVWSGSGREAWSLALISERRRQRDLAAAWARASVGARATPPVLDADLPLAGLLDAVRLLKRVADWPLLAMLIDQGLARWPQEPRLHYEAAVLYEHRLRDLPRALVHATGLGDLHRRRRLQARLARMQPGEQAEPGGFRHESA